MRTTLACFMFVSLLAACADQPTQTGSTDVSSGVSPGSVVLSDPPIFESPRITGLQWWWHGCGAEANLLPFSLTVHVVVLSADATYEVKGQAVGCDPFSANDELEPCTVGPVAIVRTLTAVAADGHGTDSETVPLVDCVNGKQSFGP